MTDNKPVKEDDDHPYLAEGIVYKPCKFCGSLEYDLADGTPTPEGVFEPITCDQCGFGMTGPHKLKIY